MSTLRLALLVDPLTARLRGGLHAIEFARALSARGHAVRLFGAQGSARHAAPIERRASDRSETKSWNQLLGYEPEAIVAYDALSPTAWYAARRARKLHVPLILVEPGHRAEGSPLMRGLARIGKTLWGAYVRHTARALVALDPIARDLAEREGFPEQTVHLMPHGVDVDVFRPGLASSLIARHHVRGRILLCTTPCGPRGGHETLISAFAGTVGQRSDWSLVIAGTGAERLRFQVDRQGVGDRVHLLPPAAAEDLPGLLSSATLIALPGLDDEVRGGDLARILASGRPVLASDHPRLRYLIGPPDCGLLAAPGEVAAWTQMLRRAAVSPEARQRWGANARKLACEKLSWADLARDFERRLLTARNGVETAEALESGAAESGQ